MKSGLTMLACSLLVGASASAVPALAAHHEAASPQVAAEELLAADRAFSAASARTDMVSGLSAMFDANVIMPLPGATFARSKSEAVAALRANPANLVSRAQWTPIRAGISADGQHGFTVGYMTLHDQGKPEPRPGKYLAYWVKRPEGWRVAAYKRAGREAGDVSTAMMPPALPEKLVPISTDEAAVDTHRKTLAAAEQSFSDEAQKIGIGPAFRKYGSADAINLGRAPAVVVGAENIGGQMGNDPTSPVVWGAEEGVIVASSGDLGVTFGTIRAKEKPPEGRPAAIPFFTIWRRASTGDPWRYVAE